jgi:uncharacterized protein YcbX
VKVVSLAIHPVKSLRAVPVDALTLDAHGAVGDREWMLVDDAGRFVTQRTTPALARFVPRVEGDVLVVETPGRPPLRVRPEDAGGFREVTVWRDTLLAPDAGDAAARWFSDALGAPVRLVRFPKDGRRLLDPKYTPRADATTRFTDAYPLLVVSLASLRSVNARLASPLGIERFRANVVVDGDVPWAEDGWRTVRLGSLVCDGVKPCARCVVITTDQLTGEKPLGSAPLDTLSEQHTLQGFGAVFGMNLVHRGPGALRVGDEVEPLPISAKEPPHAAS